MTNIDGANQNLLDELGRLRDQITTLRDSEEGFRNLAESSPEMIAIHQDGILLYINARGIKLLGANNAEQLTDKSISLFRSPEYRDGSTRYQRDIDSEHPVFVSEEELIRLDGQTIAVEITETPIQFFGMTATQMIVRDVTGRKRVEEALRQSEEQFRSFISSMSDLIFMLDPEQCFTGVFGVWLENFDFMPHTFLGRTARAVLGEEAARVHEEANAKALAGENVVYEWTFSTPHRGQVYLQTAVSPLRDNKGSITGIAGVGRDITELKRVEAEREKLIAEMDAFAHTVAHDLKHPLNLIVGYASLLESDYETVPPEQMQELLQGIVQTGLKMGNIIEELLLLAGVRKQEIQMRPLAMDIIVKETIRRLQYLIEEEHAQINLPDEWPVAIGYGPWVEEVWFNYISNAIKYGGRPPVITLDAAPQRDGTIRFWVQDNGNGLTPDEQAQVFVPFVKLTQIRAEGHGLGLSIVQRIVLRLGGKVHVESMVGKGSRFYFSLPSPTNVTQ